MIAARTVIAPHPVTTEIAPIIAVMAMAVSSAIGRGGVFASTRCVANSRTTRATAAAMTSSAHGEKPAGVGRTTAMTPANPIPTRTYVPR